MRSQKKKKKKNRQLVESKERKRSGHFLRDSILATIVLDFSFFYYFYLSLFLSLFLSILRKKLQERNVESRSRSRSWPEIVDGFRLKFSIEKNFKKISHRNHEEKDPFKI